MMATLDKFSLIAMAAGVALMLQTWWTGGFQVGFFVTLIGTVMQIVTSHAVASGTAL